MVVSGCELWSPVSGGGGASRDGATVASAVMAMCWVLGGVVAGGETSQCQCVAGKTSAGATADWLKTAAAVAAGLGSDSAVGRPCWGCVAERPKLPRRSPTGSVVLLLSSRDGHRNGNQQTVGGDGLLPPQHRARTACAAPSCAIALAVACLPRLASKRGVAAIGTTAAGLPWHSAPLLPHAVQPVCLLAWLGWLRRCPNPTTPAG